MTYGMNFAPANGNAVNGPTYTTQQQRLQIDLSNPTPLFNVVNMVAGSGLSVNAGVAQEQTEQLLVVTHNLGYIPQVYTTFLLNSNANFAGGTAVTNAYSLGQMLITSSGNILDWIAYTLTPTTFVLTHYLQSYGYGSGVYTSIANQYNLQFKYLICNNPSCQTISIN